MSYEAKVHSEGPDTLVVESGGEVIVKPGGSITNDGTSYVVTEPDDETLEVDNDLLQVKAEGIALAHLAPEVIALLDLLDDLPTENVAAPAIWNDGGVLKVGTAE